LDNTLDASLETVGFIDVKTINNKAQIFVPATTSEEPSISIANNDDSTGSVEPSPASGAAGGSSGGGTAGTLDVFLLLLTITALRCRRSLHLTPNHYRII